MTTNGTLLESFAQRLKASGLNRVNISMDTTNPEKYKEITRGGNISDLIKGIYAAREAGLEPVKLNCVINSAPQEHDAAGVAEFAKNNNLQVRFIPLMDLCRGEFGQVIGGDGGNCARCNRLRLTATGLLKPCLFSDVAFDIKKLGAEKAIEAALKHKPPRGAINSTGAFYNIGG